MTPKHTRREALLAILSSTGYQLARPLTAAGEVYRPKFFSAAQMETVDILAEIIIPGDAHSPGARAAHVSEYIDFIVSEAKPEVKALWSDGLANVDQLARKVHGKPYAQCSSEQQFGLVTAIAGNEEKPDRREEHFFVALKNATIDGYYTSAIGIHKDLEYEGNTMVLEFPGCDHESHEGAPSQPAVPRKAPAHHQN